MTDTFKIGDIVYCTSRYHGYTGPFPIEKVHKGNGNVFVNGEQYRAHGSKCGQWSTSSIEHSTPELVLKIQRIKTSRVTMARVNDLTYQKVFDADSALVVELLKLLRKF